MRPTAALRRTSLAFDAGPARERPATAPDLDDRKVLAGLIARRNRAVKTLEETRQALSSGTITKAVTERVRELTQAFAKPPQTVKGTLVVRVLGVTKHAGKAVRVPLAGLTVLAKLDGKVQAEVETNSAGIALIDLRRSFSKNGKSKDETDSGSTSGNGDDKAGDDNSEKDADQKARAVVVEVLAPDGSVVAVKKLKLETETPAPVSIELGETQALTGAFTAADPWLRARDAVTARAAEIKTRNTKALKRQASELEKTIARLDKAIEGASKSKGGKDGDDTEGKEPVRRGRDDKGGRRPRNGRRRR